MAEIGELELIHRDGLARICKFTTPHGVIETPTVMPVINPNLVVVPGREMRDMGAEAVITNSYIIRRSPDLATRALKNGVHDLIDFPGPVMTDSGTFQSYVYGDIEYDNIGMVDFQKSIGSDICTVLDVFSTPDDSYEKASLAVEETYHRAMELKPDGTIIAGTIQGSIYGDLRKRSAKLMNSLEIGYLPVGGVVPLLESYSYRTLIDIIRTSKLNSNFSKPIHLFGGGHPMFLALAVFLGVDMFDSASYVKYARDDRLLLQDRTVELKDLRYLPDWSPLHGRFSVKELQDMDRHERTSQLSRHNLFAIFNEISEIKQRISDQTLRRYVSQKVRAHPFLMDAYSRMLIGSTYEKFAEISRKSPYYVSEPTDLRDPVIARLRRFCSGIIASSDLTPVVIDSNLLRSPDVLPPWLDKLYRTRRGLYLKIWNNIPVPLELWNTYPVQQSIFRRDTARSKSRHGVGVGTTAVYVNAPVDDLPELSGSRRNLEIETLRLIGRYQFSLSSFSGILPDDSEARVSRRTGRIRTISLGNRLLATLRASDGFLTLTIEGARRFHESVEAPAHRVVVNAESAPFNSEGKNVFFKFIISADRHILAANDVIVVDENDVLLAVGKSMVSGVEMMQMRRGVAVDVRAGVDQA